MHKGWVPWVRLALALLQAGTGGGGNMGSEDFWWKDTVGLAVVRPDSGPASVSPMHTSLLLSPLLMACDITGYSQKAALCS